MHDAISLVAPVRKRLLTKLRARARESAPTLVDAVLAVLSALLLTLSFPDFNLWPLAWVGLVPLLLAVTQRPQRGASFLLGWVTGTVFFYGSCYWLTYAMIRYGGIPAPIAYLLILPATLVVGLFPAAFSVALAHLVARCGTRMLFIAPFIWVALEWVRLGLTGQLWNAIGYSQAYTPLLIQSARWGSVYAVGFLIVTVNAAVAYVLLERSALSLVASVLACALVAFVLYLSNLPTEVRRSHIPGAVMVAVQPDVPMDTAKSIDEMAALIERHQSLSEGALREWGNSPRKSLDLPRVVIWPESPMNFTYTNDSEFREIMARFATRNRASVLFNSLEPAPANGIYNAAMLVNAEGRLTAQYDKIRLLPFGEYVPLPRWLPGVNLIPVMVGDFTPGANYPLIPIGSARAGVFICFESAFPSIAREFSKAGADVLINISNDGYLGPTPVMRQHLANAVFRAVENGRPIVRVTNTGITAYITERGEVADATESFRPAVRTWTVSRAANEKTFYTKHGDLFIMMCAVMSLASLIASLRTFRRKPLI